MEFRWGRITGGSTLDFSPVFLEFFQNFPDVSLDVLEFPRFMCVCVRVCVCVCINRIRSPLVWDICLEFT